MILNQDLNFSDAPAEVKSGFSGRPPRKILLAAGHELYKFTQYDLIHNGKVTPWWSSVKPIDSNDTGLEGLLERSGRLGTTAADFARARNAVTKQWNSMSGLLLATLTSPVYAFVGRVAHQRFDDHPEYHNVVFIGGAIQLWIPNLTGTHVRRI
jgi:hypothetical protein